MWNGRRVDLEQLLGHAHALWLARAESAVDSRTGYLLSRATLLALFAAIVSTRSELAVLTPRAIPSLLFPFLIILAAGVLLRYINAYVNLNPLPHVQLPFHAAPLMQRASLQATALVARARALLATVPLPHLNLDDSEAVRSLSLFAQRMSHNWLDIRAALEAIVQLAVTVAYAPLMLYSQSAVPLASQRESRDRSPAVTVLRC